MICARVTHLNIEHESTNNVLPSATRCHIDNISPIAPSCVTLPCAATADGAAAPTPGGATTHRILMATATGIIVAVDGQ